MKRIILFKLLFLCAFNNLSATCKQIYPDEVFLKRLTSFHSYTGPSGIDRPDMLYYQKPGRTFVAKMDMVGMDRYYSLATNANVDLLVEMVMAGRGIGLDWYYYDKVPAPSGLVNIAGLPKELLIKELFKVAKPLVMGISHYDDSEELSDEEACVLVSSGADYVHGRYMKINVRGDQVDTKKYNEINGNNAAEKVIEELRTLSGAAAAGSGSL